MISQFKILLHLFLEKVTIGFIGKHVSRKKSDLSTSVRLIVINKDFLTM